FYLLSSISSIIYYGLCKLLNLNFNMSNTNNFLVVMLLLNLVAISLNLCIVSFTRSRYVAITVNILIVIPTCMLSGVFWDFEVMPNYMQKIGNLMPQRWVYICIENLQIYGSLSSIYQYIFYMIAISLILFSLSLFMFRIRKIKV
ncbi:ABC transporter permease, partial [Clostridium celatum]